MRNASLSLCAVALFASVAASAATSRPVTGYYYPSSLQIGTKTRVVIGGMNCGAVNGGYITGGGVRITRVVHVPGFPRATGKGQLPFVFDWLYAKLEGDNAHRALPPEATADNTDWSKSEWWENIDKHDDFEVVAMLRWLYTPNSYPQPTPALDQVTILDIEVDKDAKPGRRDIMVCDGREVSVPHALYITEDPHVAEPYFTVPPRPESLSAGDPLLTLHIPNHFEPHALPVTFDGQCWAGEVDRFKLQLVKGQRVTCELIGRELLPYLGDAVPGWFNPVMKLTNEKGKEVGYADDFFYLPDPIISIVVPETGIYTLEVFDNLYRGRQDFVYFVRCYEDKPNGPFITPQQKAFECFPRPKCHYAGDIGKDGKRWKGVIDCPGRTVRCNFRIEEPIATDFRLFARRAGSPLNGVLKLYGPLAGNVPLAFEPLLATWEDSDQFLGGSIPQALTDPEGSWTFREPGNYAVVVSDCVGAGGDDYSYELVMKRHEPYFEVYVERSSFLARDENAIPFKAKAVRKNGFKGEIKFVDTDELSFAGTISENEDTAEIMVSANGDWKGVKCVEFSAKGEIEPGVERKVLVTPSDPAEQAFAYTHLLPALGFYFCRPVEN